MSRINSDTRSKILDAAWRLMEQNPNQLVRMSDIASEIGISRQAVYLHFSTRTELLIATSNYVDETKGLAQKLQQLKNLKTGKDLLESCVEIWGNYIPEIYGLAKALLAMKEVDQAAAMVWNQNMACLLDVCREIVETINKEGNLPKCWTKESASKMIWTTLSIHNWELLTIECGWSGKEYIKYTKMLLKRAFFDCV